MHELIKNLLLAAIFIVIIYWLFLDNQENMVVSRPSKQPVQKSNKPVAKTQPQQPIRQTQSTMSPISGNVVTQNGVTTADLKNYNMISTNMINTDNLNVMKNAQFQNLSSDFANIKSVEAADINVSGNLTGNSAAFNYLSVDGKDVMSLYDDKFASISDEIQKNKFVMPDSLNLKNLDVNGNANFKGKLYSASGSFDSLNVRGEDIMNVITNLNSSNKFSSSNSDVNIGGNLDVDGDTKISGNLAMTGRIAMAPKPGINCPGYDMFNNRSVNPPVANMKDIDSCTGWCLKNADQSLAYTVLSSDGTCWCKTNGCQLINDGSSITQQIL